MTVDPRTLANQALAPVLAALQAQKAQEQTAAANQQATAAASAQGLSQALAPIPGQIQDTYKQAGDSTSAYAKGFSAAFQQGSEQTANDLNAFLAKQGSPQQVQSAGAKGADVLYGLGGFIPASGLAREGAAFSAAAEAFPASALLRGQETQALIGRDSAGRLAQLDAQLGAERAKQPGLVQEIRAQQAEQATKDRAAKLNELIAVENLGIRQEQLGVSKQNALTSAQRLKLDAAKERFDQALAEAKLDLDASEYDLAVQREERLSKPKQKGGFTAKQKQDLAEIAFDTAEDDFKGGEYEKGKFVGFDPKLRRPPVETLRDLMAQGVPFSLAMKAIQRFARGEKPADMDAATWALWRATRGWTKN